MEKNYIDGNNARIINIEEVRKMKSTIKRKKKDEKFEFSKEAEVQILKGLAVRCLAAISLFILILVSLGYVTLSIMEKDVLEFLVYYATVGSLCNMLVYAFFESDFGRFARKIIREEKRKIINKN